MSKSIMNKGISKLFKPYFVKRKNGQCQILIPLVELDELVNKIVAVKEGRITLAGMIHHHLSQM